MKAWAIRRISDGWWRSKGRSWAGHNSAVGFQPTLTPGKLYTKKGVAEHFVVAGKTELVEFEVVEVSQ